MAARALVTAPAVEPLILLEVKDHLRVDFDEDDPLLQGLIKAAREYAEEVTGRALITQDWDYFLDEFPGGTEIALPFPPLQSVASVKYTDKDNVVATFDSAKYQVDTQRQPGRILLKDNETWPSDTLRPANGVEVRFKAGYGDDRFTVPEAIRRAMLLHIGAMYEHREAVLAGQPASVVPFAFDSLISPHRVWSF